MSAIHQQAMTYVYQQVLQRLLEFYSRAERTALQLLVQRLIVAAGGIERIGTYRVLVAQNGSREGFYALTALRAAQLSIAGRHPTTFDLRVATPRLGEMTQATLENIHCSYSALFLYDDPRVELLMADNREVVPFDRSKPLSAQGREANRTDMLMLGHLRSSDSLLGVGDEGYLAMAEFYKNMARWDAGVDSWVSCDTPRQQKQFLSGLRRATRKIGLVFEPVGGFDGLFAQLDFLGSDLFRRFYGQEHLGVWQPERRLEACRQVGHIRIDDLITERLEESNWALFSEFLGVSSDELVAPSLEHEYLSPYLSAHLCGLQACHQQERGYAAGYTDYVQRMIMVMHRKRMPEPVCQQVQGLLGAPSEIPERRAVIALETEKNLNLNETQLVCMLFAPFVEKGAGLEHFLRCCHPGMLVGMPDLHRALRGGPVTDQVAHWMVDVSGLPVAMLCKLYRARITTPEPEIIRADPQTAMERADTDQGGQGADDPGERAARR